MSILGIEREDHLAIYDLSVGVNCQSLIVSVNNAGYLRLQERLSGPGLKKPWFFSDDLNLPQFLSPSDSWLYCGFGPVATQVDSKNESMTSLEVILPKVVKYPPGFEKAKALGLEKEIWEEGYDYTLWSYDVNWNFAHCVSATLTTLFKTLSLTDIPVSSKKMQLMEVDMGTRLGDGYISVSLGKSLLPYLNLQPDNSYHRAGEAMKTAYEYMMGRNEYSDKNRFEVWCRGNHWINLICPGDRCGLDPNDYYKTEDGYTIYPHNVDTVAQQLTLLMGVAALNQEVRQMGF